MCLAQGPQRSDAVDARIEWAVLHVVLNAKYTITVLILVTKE